MPPQAETPSESEHAQDPFGQSNSEFIRPRPQHVGPQPPWANADSAEDQKHEDESYQRQRPRSDFHRNRSRASSVDFQLPPRRPSEDVEAIGGKDEEPVSVVSQLIRRSLGKLRGKQFPSVPSKIQRTLSGASGDSEFEGIMGIGRTSVAMVKKGRDTVLLRRDARRSEIVQNVECESTPRGATVSIFDQTTHSLPEQAKVHYQACEGSFESRRTVSQNRISTHICFSNPECQCRLRSLSEPDYGVVPRFGY